VPGSQSTGNCWWFSRFSDFRSATTKNVIDRLIARANRSGLDATAQSRSAWFVTKAALDRCYDNLTTPEKEDWWIGLEFEIPRVDKRVDCVVLTKSCIIVIEFKTGENRSQRAAEFQVSDYALNLRHLHSTSIGRPIIPLVVLTDPVRGSESKEKVSADDERVWVESTETLDSFLARVASDVPMSPQPLEALKWVDGRFERTPGILEVIRHVATNHDVLEIRHHKGDHVEDALKRVRSIITEARTDRRHVICFVDGVPGAGKTFLGLGATQPDSSAPDLTGTYLSGNGPLVKVVSYALELDHRRKGGKSTAPVRGFVQPVHAFINSEYRRADPPSEHVIVFDEAQRAWSAHQMSKFHEGEISCSEASAALEIMQRHQDWAVVVALIGSGQEIDRGEAGIAAWLEAAATSPRWSMIGPASLSKRSSAQIESYHVDHRLHLSVGIRSPHSLTVTSWIEALLAGKIDEAKEIANQTEFPILATRDLSVMRGYLRDRARSDCRVGLVAPSKDRRLRAFGIERSTPFLRGVNFAHWFVHDQDDVRSSYSLEVAASEFDCQGLELDWVGMCWGGDFYFEDSWKSQRFVGRKWQREADHSLAINRYRVLLSRARSGMVIWVPEDRTQKHLEIPRDKLDRTWDTLVSAGVRSL